MTVFTFHFFHGNINILFIKLLSQPPSQCLWKDSFVLLHLLLCVERKWFAFCMLFIESFSTELTSPPPSMALSILILQLPTTWCPIFSLARAVPKPCDSCELTPSCTGSEPPAVRHNLHFHFYHLSLMCQGIWTSACIHSQRPLSQVKPAGHPGNRCIPRLAGVVSSSITRCS